MAAPAELDKPGKGQKKQQSFQELFEQKMIQMINGRIEDIEHKINYQQV